MAEAITVKKLRKARASKREDIIQASMRVFCHYGFDGSTLEKIANEAGVSKALIIKYFVNQRSILSICLNRFMEEFIQKARKHARRKGTTYRQHCDYVFKMFKENRPQLQLLISIFLTPAHADIRNEMLPKYLELTKELTGFFADSAAPGLQNQLNYSMYSLLVGYVIGGNQQNFLSAREELLKHYLGEKTS